ncbi:MAG TPA: hypothetical protein VGB53_13555 [Rubricoccaceae bacterium]|jgi:hypothetical protein
MSRPIDILSAEPFTRLSRRFLKMVAKGELTPGDLLVLLVVADKTVSWKRLWQELSYTDLETATGMSRKGLTAIVTRLTDADLIVRKAKGRSFEYALVPAGWTGDQVLASSTAEDVNNPVVVVTSGNRHRLPEVDDRADRSMYFPKKTLKNGRRPVDEGMKGKAEPTCALCRGEGWVVTIAADGFTESVSRCLCTNA